MEMRMKLAYGLFIIGLIWPAIHLCLTLNKAFCPWRFAGWGMYSVPYPDEFSSVRIFICRRSQRNCQKIIKTSLLTSDSQGKEIPTLEIFTLAENENFNKLKLDDNAWNLFDPYFSKILQLSPSYHLRQLIKQVLSWIKLSHENLSDHLGRNPVVIAIISEQRLHIKQGQLYVKYKSYQLY